MTIAQLKQENAILKAKLEDAVNSNMAAIDRLKEYELGRRIILPNQITPSQYNQILEWLKGHKAKFEESVNNQLPEEVK